MTEIWTGDSDMLVTVESGATDLHLGSPLSEVPRISYSTWMWLCVWRRTGLKGLLTGRLHGGCNGDIIIWQTWGWSMRCICTHLFCCQIHPLTWPTAPSDDQWMQGVYKNQDGVTLFTTHCWGASMWLIWGLALNWFDTPFFGCLPRRERERERVSLLLSLWTPVTSFCSEDTVSDEMGNKGPINTSCCDVVGLCDHQTSFT